MEEQEQRVFAAPHTVRRDEGGKVEVTFTEAQRMAFRTAAVQLRNAMADLTADEVKALGWGWTYAHVLQLASSRVHATELKTEGAS